MQRVAGWWLLLCLSLATACGGRYESSSEQQPSGGKGGGTTVPGETDACRTQRQAYSDYREELLAQFSAFSCMQDSDCVVFYNQTSCDSSCVLTTSAAKRGVIDGLNNYALSNCSSDCLPANKPNCGDPPSPNCSNGQCLLPR